MEPLKEYHRVMTMEDFMSDLAPTIWPVGKRIGNVTRSFPSTLKLEEILHFVMFRIYTGLSVVLSEVQLPALTLRFWCHLCPLQTRL